MATLTRRAFGRAALATALTGLALPAFAQAAARPFRLILTHLEPPLVPNSVLDLALQLGYFAREGVNVQLVRVQQTPLAMTALLTGEGEMANVSVDAVLLNVAGALAGTTPANRRVVAIGSPNESIGFLIAARSGITSIAGLAGQRFGIASVGSLDYTLTLNMLEAAGFDTRTMQLVPAGQPAARAQALASGQIDATTMSIGVWTSMPDSTGLRILVDPADYYAAAPIVNKVNVVLPNTLATRRAEVAGVTRALIRISRDFAADPGLWAEAMAAAIPNVALETLRQIAGNFAGDGSWSVNGGLNAEKLRYTQDWIYANSPEVGRLPRLTVGQWVDFSVTDEILHALGVDPWGDPPIRLPAAAVAAP